MSICVFNARVVTESEEFLGGVLVDDRGKIERVIRGATAGAAGIKIDARGRLLFAGFVDAHVHMRDPGLTHKEDFGTGTQAAVCGGVTTVMCMPNTSPPIETPEGLALAIATGGGRSYADFCLQAYIHAGNLDQLPALWAAGVTSFESSLSDGREGVKVVSMDDTHVLLDALSAAARLKATVGLYTGNEQLTAGLSRKLKAAGMNSRTDCAHARPALSEAIGIATLIEVARHTGARIVYRQVCSARGFELIRGLRARTSPEICAVEVTPHNLHLTEADIEAIGPMAQIIPPLRGESDRAATVSALVDGTADFVGSDHAPHSWAEKARDNAWEARNGSPGLDTVVAAIMDLACRGLVPFRRVAQVLGAAPARIFGIADRKGRLAEGADGDLVIVDPGLTRVVEPAMIRSKPGRSVFEGRALRGWPVVTILRGTVVAEQGRLIGTPAGRYVARVGSAG